MLADRLLRVNEAGLGVPGIGQGFTPGRTAEKPCQQAPAVVLHRDGEQQQDAGDDPVRPEVVAGDDDHGLLTRGFMIYDALFAWLRFAADERHNWPARA